MQSRSRVSAVAGMVSPVLCPLIIGFLAGCDQPTAPSATPAADIAAAQTTLPAYAVDCVPMAGSLAGDKAVRFTVVLSDGTSPAQGTVVTAINPEFGPTCWGATDANGQVALVGLKRGAGFVFSVRDEVSLDAPRLEIVPPDPLSGLSFGDVPTDAANRHAAMLLGGASCDDLRPLTWSSYDVLHSAPCLMTEHRDLSVTLAATTTSTATFLGPSGEPLANVIVAAISPATLTSTDLPTSCAKMPFRDQQECVNNSHGPAMLQAMGLTGPDGTVDLGAFGGPNDPVVIEAVFEQNGLTQFATLISGEQMTALLSPGMCDVETVVDENKPGKYPKVDILSTSSSVGMVARDADPLSPGPELMPVSSTLIVKLRVKVSHNGGDGDFGLQYRTAESKKLHTILADFAIDTATDECLVGEGSGDGMKPGVTFTGTCAQVPGTEDEYILFFQTDGLEGIVEAMYGARTQDDVTSPLPGDPQYERGVISITRLAPAVCPVQFNNDGRWNTA